jgi:hypothetical protein
MFILHTMCNRRARRNVTAAFRSCGCQRDVWSARVKYEIFPGLYPLLIRARSRQWCDRFSMKKPLRSSARGASFHTNYASNANVDRVVLLDANSYLADWFCVILHTQMIGNVQIRFSCFYIHTPHALSPNDGRFGVVVGILGYYARGRGFNSRRMQTFVCMNMSVCIGSEYFYV